jgi:hypothetical protein
MNLGTSLIVAGIVGAVIVVVVARIMISHNRKQPELERKWTDPKFPE